MIYIEEEIKDHPRTLAILERLKPKKTLVIERYQEVFNRKNQNFRLQKENPAIILAKKHGSFLHPIPSKFGIGGSENYYFSHMLNCPFDCSYCYLQGMYRSAYFVFFINFEDFQDAILEKEKPGTHFFSGYDADSLAMEPKTHFLKEFIPFFKTLPETLLEVRTKSIGIRPLLEQAPQENVLIAYSLSPSSVSREVERKTPPLENRLDAIEKLQEKGWKIGLRFDPIIYQKNYPEVYEEFFHTVFSRVKDVHSATLGGFRLPKSYYKNMQKIGAAKELFPLLKEKEGEMHYSKESEMIAFCEEKILQHLTKKKLFTI